MKKTPLHDLHLSLGAKMTQFAGYEMPLRYAGTVKEHTAARTEAALFDTCHMGEFKISGAGAIADLERILSCDIVDIRIGACRYGLMCNASGGVLDDLILYRMAESVFMLVVNAATAGVDFDWIEANVSVDTKLENISETTAKIDLNGPAAPKIAAKLLRDPVDGLKYYNFAKNRHRGEEVTVSRTGYTGEIGFEIYCPAAAAADLWNDCVAAGAVPAGLGARDSLRLEMGYPLYGHELTAGRNAAQADLSRAISRKKGFIGSNAVFAPEADCQLLRGIALFGRQAARQGDAVLDRGGKKVGTATSGCFAPSLGHAVALAYVNRESAEIGTELTLSGERGEIPGKISPLPFYKNATARTDIKLYLY
jgi:aminomethyltransferase